MYTGFIGIFVSNLHKFDTLLKDILYRYASMYSFIYIHS